MGFAGVVVGIVFGSSVFKSRSMFSIRFMLVVSVIVRFSRVLFSRFRFARIYDSTVFRLFVSKVSRIVFSFVAFSISKLF